MKTSGKIRVLPRERVIGRLNREYPGLDAVPVEEFSSDYSDGIWIKGSESGLVDRNGTPLFDYYQQDGDSKLYNMGIVAHLERWAQRNGWYFEWYDAGTVMMFEQ